MTGQSIGVHIVSGFLGAGKTTFINKLFADGVDPCGTVLIENELGDTSVDDELISAQDLEVRTLTSGCVCCSLRSDLADTIEMVVDKFSPHTILIEPTGVASPDELTRICTNDLWNLPLEVESVITIVNAMNAEELLDLDIGVFDVQLMQAHLLVLSRTQFMRPEEIARTSALLREHVGWPIPIVETPWDDLDALEVLGVAQEALKLDAPARGDDAAAHHAHESHHEHGHENEHEHDHDHDHEHEHGAHTHSADGLGSLVVQTDAVFDKARLKELSELLESGDSGQILRAKGFVIGEDDTTLHIEYVYGSMQVSPIDYAGEPKIVIIGRNLNHEALMTLG